jgi:hypothetical protein
VDGRTAGAGGDGGGVDMSKRDNTKKSRATVKRGPGGKWAKGTPSPNPDGAPKRGDSWAETIKLIGEMDGPSIAALWDTQQREFAKLPDGITMKQLVVMTAYATLLRETSPGNWREMMDRADGPVKQQTEHSGSVTLIEVDLDGAGQSQD